eukprot:TRINITY_DN19776_c0_g1_i8.p2 TRINITY_DN19776_c0_g1~~TRINITY_DN19776_c0_g1_i8.p2  ORF type:complete len:169 (+),score=35.67 TRINITY_DN19776_c0_g1_i8:122-628(+)
MKLNNIPAPVWYAGFAVLAVGGVVWYLKSKGGTDLINPASDKNVVNQGATSLLQNLGIVDKDSSIGSTIYDWLHYDYDPNAPAGSPNATQASIFNPLAAYDWFSNRYSGSSGSSSTQAPATIAAPGDARSEYVTRGSTDAPTTFNLDSFLSGIGLSTSPSPRYSFASY